MTGINFYLKEKQKDYSLVCVSVSCTDGRAQLSTAERIETKYWNATKQRVITKGNPRGTATNNILNHITSQMNEKFDALTIAKLPLNIAAVKDVLKSILNQTNPDHDTEQVKTFWQYFDDYLLRDRLTSDGLPIKAQSYTSYKVAYQRFKDFESSKKLKIDFCNINKAMLEKFVSFLFTKPNHNYKDDSRIGLAPSTVALTIKRLKTVLSDAIDNGYSVPNDHKKAKVKSVTPTEIAFNENELMQLYHYDFSDNKGYDQVRDLFLIGCYTALRYSDYSKVCKENIKQWTDGTDYLCITTEKTGTAVEIPTVPIVTAILGKYNGTLPKPFTNQIMNRYLKEICEVVGFSSVVKVTEYEQGQRKENDYKKFEKVSTHTARRTGATMMYNITKDIVLCMSITGHKTESQFRKYIRNDSITNAQTLNDAFVKSGFGNITAPKKNHLFIVSKAV